jgi:predicted transport protein
MTIIGNGKRFTEVKHLTEKDFEEDVLVTSQILFGKDTIFINAKKKIESKSLGGTIPDGFFFDFSDTTDPQFYIVEVEVTKHSFFNHIFPQITKFFAFFKNTKLRKELVDKLYKVIQEDATLRANFKKYLDRTEIHKYLSDVVETQNILLIADGDIRELPEIMDTYTDTWGKLVKFLVIRKFISGTDTIYTITPDFENIQYIDVTESPEEAEATTQTLSEEFHLEDVFQNVKDIYVEIKKLALSIDNALVFNPQKYYISIKKSKNIAFIKLRKKKIRFIPMLPEDRIKSIVHSYPVAHHSEGIQDFYNGPCAAVDIANLDHVSEIRQLLADLIEYHSVDLE